MRKILFGKFSIIILAVFVVLTACSSKNEKQSETIGTQHKKYIVMKIMSTIIKMK